MLRIRPYKKQDIKTIISWIRNEKEFYFWSAGRFGEYPLTEEVFDAYYEKAYAEDDFWGMTAFDEKGITGHITMRFLDKEKTVLRFGFIIVDGSRRGEGLGKNMLLSALKYAFEILKVKKVSIGVFEENVPAFGLYESLGFKDTNKNESYSLLGKNLICRELELIK